MSNIKTYLENILKARFGKDVRQSIHDAIKEIDAVADTAQDSATKMAAMAGNHEASAKASMESALASAESARISAEQAMSGTPEGYEALVEQVGLLDIAKSTGNTLYNSKKGGYRLNDLVGNTEQKTLSGKNLLNVIETLSFNTKYIPIKLVAGTYHITCSEVTNAGTIGVVAEIKGSAYKLTSGCDITFTLTEDFSSTVGLYSNGYDYVGSQDVTATVKQLMISKDGGEYEPYCGGTPSPNPLFPQAIENTFDGVEMKQGKVSSSGAVTSSANHVHSNHIPCKNGDIISMQYHGDFKYLYIYCFDKNGASVGSKYSATDNPLIYTAPSNCAYAIIDVAGKTDITPQTVGKITLTVNGKYVGQIVRCDSKNLFDYNNHVANDRVSKFEVVGGKTLYRNASLGDTSVWGVYDNNDNLLGTFKDYSFGPSNPLVLPNNASYIKTTDRATALASQYIGYETVDAYNNRTEKVATFFLNEPLRATDRVVRKDGVIYENHKRKTKTLNGTESGWYMRTSDGLFCIAISDKKTTQCNIISDQYIATTSITLNNGEVFGYNSNFGNNVVAFANTSCTTLDEWKALLQTNPITVEYELAEPTYTPLDTESQLALNSLETFDTVTYIEVDSKVKASGINAEYGTSQVGAYTLKSLLNTESNAVKLDELAVALVATGRE